MENVYGYAKLRYTLLGNRMYTDTEILKFAIPAIIAVLGWFAAHQFNAYRDNKNKRRDIRIQYLLDAYRRLEGASNRPESDKETQDSFESALADIQLLGNKDQIDLLMRFLSDFNNGGASINPLLEMIRAHLRDELGLKNDVQKIRIFRFEKRFPNKANQPTPRSGAADLRRYEPTGRSS